MADQAVSKDKQIRILGKLVKGFLVKERITLQDIPEAIASFSKMSGIDPRDVIDVLEPLFMEAAKEAFSLRKVKKAGRHRHHHGH